MENKKQYILPAEDVNEDEASITEIFFQNGDYIQKDDVIYTFETTKATVDVTSDIDGFIYYSVEIGQEVEVGSIICEVLDQKREKRVEQKTVNPVAAISATKKALKLAENHNLKINELGLCGVVREKDLLPFIETGKKRQQLERCKFLDRNDEFIKFTLEDKSFRFLSSDEKIEKYREEGFQIDEGVIIGHGSIIIGNKIKIGRGVTIGANSYIEASDITVGQGSRIGNNCEIVGSVIDVGSFNRIANKVNIDISGGRYPDSNLKTGRGCLIASDAYINICREVLLGENVALSPRAMIFTHSYWQSVLEGYSSNFGPVVIENDSWVGAAAQIMPNVIISTGSIVMSNSLVVNNVTKHSLVGGVPASIVKENIKKDFGINTVTKKLALLFESMVPWLYSLNYDVKKLGSSLISIKKMDLQIVCMLYDLDGYDKNRPKEVDILIVYKRPNRIQFKYKSILVISEKKIEGTIGELESHIVEYFRRNGINFYE